MSRLLADAGWRRTAAGAHPRQLLLRPRFWRGHAVFVATLAASGFLLVLLAPYTYSWSDGWSGYLSLAVQGLAAWGAAVCVAALARLEVDTALACEMDARGSGYLADLKSRRRAQVDLQQLEETVVPNNPATPAPAPIRLFQHICKEAKDRRFDSAANLTQTYREEALEDIFRLQNLQKIALWLGILGTFIGLLVALQQSDLEVAGGDEALTRIVQEMYGGLFISFTASVAGLEVAIILGFLLLLVRRRQELYFAQLESAAVTLLSVARHSINRDDFLAEFSQVTGAVHDLTGRVFEQTRELSEGLENVHRQLREQNARIDAGLDRLAAARGEFDGFLAQIGEAEHEFITDLKRVFHAASFKDFGLALEAGVRQAGSDVSARLEQIASHSAAQMEAFNTSVETLGATLQAEPRELAQAVDALSARLTESSAQNAGAVRAAYEQLRADAARHSGSVQAVTSQFSQLSSRLAELNASIHRLRPRGSRLGDLLASLTPSWRLRRP